MGIYKARHQGLHANHNAVFCISHGGKHKLIMQERKIISCELRATATGLKPRNIWFANEASTILPKTPVWLNG